MPLQILQREKLDTSGLNAGVTNLREAMQFKKELSYKSNLLDYQIKQLGVQSRQAATDEEKLQLETQKASMEKLKSLVDIATRIEDPEMRKKFLATYGSEGAANGTFKEALSNPAIQDILSQVKPKGEERLQGAAATMLENRLNPQQGGATPQDASGGMTPLGPTSLNRAGALNGNMPTQGGQGGYELSPEISLPGGMKMIDRSTQLRQMGEDVRTKKQAEQAVELAPLKTQMNLAKSIFAKSIDEMGGLGDDALSARLKGYVADVGSEIGQMPATQTLNKIRKGLGLSLGSFMNRGRPTDKDQEAAFMTLFSNKYPLATNMYLMDYIDAVLSGGADYGQLNTITSSPQVLQSFANTDRTAIEAFMKKGLSESEANQALYEIKLKRSPFRGQ